VVSGCGGGDCTAPSASGCGGAASLEGNPNIELRFVVASGTPGFTGELVARLQNVKSRLERAITRKLGGSSVSLGQGDCGPKSPALHQHVDDLLVLVSIEPIDGPNTTGETILAEGAPCLVRSSSHLPVVSYVRLDVADLGGLEQSGALEPVFLHELLHALGFGSLWGNRYFGYLENPSKPNRAGADTYFSGANAIAAFDSVGGTTYPLHKVPVENSGGGEADTHWRGAVLRGELMQPFLQDLHPALSLLTLGSLQDLGYSVDLSQADSYSMRSPNPAASSAPAGAMRFDAASRVPLRVVDPSGRVLRIIQR
jgi:hypothetical protein